MMSETRPAAAAIAPAQSQRPPSHRRRSSFQIHMADAESLHRHLVRTAERDERQLVRRLKRLQLKMLLTLVEDVGMLGIKLFTLVRLIPTEDEMRDGGNDAYSRETLLIVTASVAVSCVMLGWAMSKMKDVKEATQQLRAIQDEIARLSSDGYAKSAAGDYLADALIRIKRVAWKSGAHENTGIPKKLFDELPGDVKENLRRQAEEAKEMEKTIATLKLRLGMAQTQQVSGLSAGSLSGMERVGNDGAVVPTTAGEEAP